MKRAVLLATLAIALALSPALAATPGRHAPARADSVSTKRAAVSGRATPTTPRVAPHPTTRPAPRPDLRADVAAARPPGASRAGTQPRRSVLEGLAVEPIVASSQDSDGNRTFGTGLSADLAARRGVRVGLQSMRTRVEDGVSRGHADDLRLQVAIRPLRTLRIAASAGAARLSAPTGVAPLQVVGGLRTRWRPPGKSPALEFRVERTPLLANPLLLDHRAIRSDGRFGVEVPVRGWRLRGAVRGAVIESAGERNHRGQVDAAVALPLSPACTPFLQYRSLGYLHPARTGYFAPHRVEVVESGSSFELGSGSPWLLAAELGAGIQRLQEFGETLRPWGPAVRGYGYLSYAASGCELRLEAENENSPGLATSSSKSWRYSSVSFALRWALP